MAFLPAASTVSPALVREISYERVSTLLRTRMISCRLLTSRMTVAMVDRSMPVALTRSVCVGRSIDLMAFNTSKRVVVKAPLVCSANFLVIICTTLCTVRYVERSTLLVPFAGTGFCGALAAGLGADLTTGFGAGFAGGLLAAIFLVGFGAGLLGAGLVDFLAGLEGFDMFDSRSLYVVCCLYVYICVRLLNVVFWNIIVNTLFRVLG